MLFFGDILECKQKIVGGQALFEGVMMKNDENVCAVVRRADGQMELKDIDFTSALKSNKLFSLFILRGFVSLVEMMALGFKTLQFSIDRAMLDESEKTSKKKSDLRNKIETFFSYLLAIILTFLFFIYAPYKISEFLPTSKDNFFFNLFAGVFRVSFFVIYVFAISLFKDIKRVFQYHGAEHIAVNAYEKQMPLEAEKIKDVSTINPRCGTSFVFLLLLISILIFSVVDSVVSLYIGVPNIFLRIGYHLLLIPLISGVAFEFLRYSSRNRANFFVKLIIAPGLAIQKITTKKPSVDQIEVAVVALKHSLNHSILSFKNLKIL